MDGSAPATPRVDEQELYNVLCGAASQDASLLQHSTKALKTMIDDRFGTFDTLQSIAAQKSVPLPVRQLALIQFKNHALGHWRSRKVLSDELRQSIKQRTLAFLDEEDDTLAGTNAYIVAKLARSEIQTNWYSLLAAELMSIISSGLQTWVGQKDPGAKAPTPLRRSLQYLHAMIKELSSMKMLGGIKATGQIVTALFQTLFDFYSALVPEITSLNLSTLATPRAAENIAISHLVFKTLSKLSTWLFTQIGKKDKDYQVLEPMLQQFCQAAAVQLPVLADLRIELVRQYNQSPPSDLSYRTVGWLTRHVSTYGKLFRRLQQLDKSRFVSLPRCTELVFYYWGKVVQSTQAPPEFVADSPLAVYPVRFLVQAMVLFQNSLSVWAPVTRRGIPNAVVMPENDVTEAVKILVKEFIPLKVNDLQEWERNPEQWVNDEDAENDQWEYELRPCGERLLLTFANQYSQFVVPLLVDTFKDVAEQKSFDLRFIQQKEALYCAIGRCAHKLKDKIPFHQWLESTLLPESRETNPLYRIIKRRIAWVIGKWVSEQCASPQNPRVWEILVHLLQEEGTGTDAVVQVTAAMALCDCVDTIDFDIQVFLPFLQPAVARLVYLASEADDITTKRRIAKALNVVVERAGHHIVPLMEPIARSIPNLWSEAEDDWLFKASLVETTTKLVEVEAANAQSRLLHPLVIPLIRESLAPGAMMHLDEDALTLWLSTLRCSVPPLNGSPNVFDLLPSAIMLLHDNLDLLGNLTGIVESYYLLDASIVLQHAVPLFQAYRSSLSHAFSVNIKHLLISLQLLVQLTPSSLWGEAMHISGLFPFLFKTLLDEKADSLVLAEHVHLFARIAVVDSKMFCQLVNATISINPMKVDNPEEAAWEGLMDQWWNRFDSMSEPRHRKLTAMAMANLITSINTVVLKRLPSEIFNLWLDVFGEVKEAANRSEERPDSPLTRYWEQDDAPEAIFGNTEGTPEYERRKAMWDADPVRTTQLTAFVAARLRETELAMSSGPVGLQSIMASADPTVLQQIQAELTGAR